MVTEASTQVTIQQGKLYMLFENVPQSIFTNNQQLLQDTFLKVYNNVSGGCNGLYKRIAHEATFSMEKVQEDYTTLMVYEGNGNDNVTKPTSEQNELHSAFVNTTWEVLLSCIGCLDDDPLFASLLIDTASNTEKSQAPFHQDQKQSKPSIEPSARGESQRRRQEQQSTAKTFVLLPDRNLQLQKPKD